jgi:hypothetical protein
MMASRACGLSSRQATNWPGGVGLLELKLPYAIGLVGADEAGDAAVALEDDAAGGELEPGLPTVLVAPLPQAATIAATPTLATFDQVNLLKFDLLGYALIPFTALPTIFGSPVEPGLDLSSYFPAQQFAGFWAASSTIELKTYGPYSPPPMWLMTVAGTPDG